MNGKEEDRCAKCGQETGCHHYCDKHLTTHIIIKVVIIIIVFWIGVKVGELRSLFGYGYCGYQMYPGYMMRGSYGPNGNNWYGPGMMGYGAPGYGYEQSTTTAK